MSQECSICIEPYNKSVHKPIDCINCNFKCCKSCFKRYITDREHLLQCMSCRNSFDRSILHKYLGSQFIQTEFRDIREYIIYERERAFFPMTQELIEIENILAKIKKLRNENFQLYFESTTLEKERKIRENIITIRQLTLDYRSRVNNTRSKDKKPKRTYIIPCTKDNCKGTLTNESKDKLDHYICGLCDGRTCAKCKMEVTDLDHKCDPNILETVRFVESSSRPCPSCHALIYKISGCNQMFCTVCHCIFD